MTKMNDKNDLLKRYAILIFGMFIMSFGIAMAIKGGLGTSPISSVSYALSVVGHVSVGKGSIMFNTFLVILQIILLRKDFKPYQLLQLPVTFIFGYMNDFAMYCLDWVHCSSYAQQMICCLIGVVLVGVGVSIEVTPDVLVLPGEGIVSAFSQVTKIKFGTMKIIVDCSCAATAIVLGLVTGYGVLGVREGTIISALCTGNVVRKVKPLAAKAAKLS